MDLTELAALARNRLATGHLPRSCHERKLFAGSGEGVACACCGLQITPQQVQYDVVCASSIGESQLFSMHLPCFTVWAQLSDEEGGPSAPPLLGR